MKVQAFAYFLKGSSATTPGYSKNNPYGLRGRFITNIKFKARLHALDFVMDLGHIATAMLPLRYNELTERCYHFGLTFVMKHPLNIARGKTQVCNALVYISMYSQFTLG